MFFDAGGGALFFGNDAVAISLASVSTAAICLASRFESTAVTSDRVVGEVDSGDGVAEDSTPSNELDCCMVSTFSWSHLSLCHLARRVGFVRRHFRFDLIEVERIRRRGECRQARRYGQRHHLGAHIILCRVRSASPGSTSPGSTSTSTSNCIASLFAKHL